MIFIDFFNMIFIDFDIFLKTSIDFVEFVNVLMTFILKDFYDFYFKRLL